MNFQGRIFHLEMYALKQTTCTLEAVAPLFQGQTITHPTPNKDLSHAQALLSRPCKDVVRYHLCVYFAIGAD